jgi:spore coat-associated protein N
MLNKKMLLSILIIGCIATMASAGTFAYFDSTQSTLDNSVKAGDLKLNTGTISTVALSVTNAKPLNDYIPIPSTFTVSNDGSISGDLTASVATADITGGSHIANDMSIYITNKDGTATKCLVLNGVSQGPVKIGSFGSNAYYTPVVSYYFRDTGAAQNLDQDETFNFKITFNLKQN